MRDERSQSTSAAMPVADPAPTLRAGLRGRRIAVIAGAFAVLVGVAGAAIAWSVRSSEAIAVRMPTIDERIEALELDAMACDGASSSSAESLPPLILPPSSNRSLRSRMALAQAALSLRDDRPAAALERLDLEANADPDIVDGAWRSRRLQCLRRAERFADADREVDEWCSSLGEDHPERAWADAERSLHRALSGRTDEAESIAAPWLGRSLSPVAASRLRLAEALLRSARGDHAVAAAAFAGARAADAVCEPTVRLLCADLVSMSLELSEDASASGALRASIELCEQGLELASAGPERIELLRRHAAACRSDAMTRFAALSSASGGADDAAPDPVEVESTNRRFLAAAASAEELAERMSMDARGDGPAVRAAAMQCAAECWERAGRTDDAVRAWREWLRWRPDSDPERAEVLRRIAELLHGLQQFEQAIDAYAMLTKIHPNSPQAARAPISAARAHRALGQDAEAARLLDVVLTGGAGIDPESPAYAEALLERGRLAHATGEAHIACRRLEELLRRDPVRDDAGEVRLLLADAWRTIALEFEASAAAPAAPSERADARARSSEAWSSAAANFAIVVGRFDSIDLPADDPAMRDRSRLARVGLAASLEACGRLDEAIVAWEEVDRRHPDTESALVALERLRHLPGVDSSAMRRRALLRLDGLADDGTPRLLSNDAWRLWFEAPSDLLAHAPTGGAE